MKAFAIFLAGFCYRRRGFVLADVAPKRRPFPAFRLRIRRLQVDDVQSLFSDERSGRYHRPRSRNA